MNYNQEKQEVEKLFKQCLEMLCSKANDYAKDEDVFSNFKKIAYLSDIPTEKTFLVFMTVKIARLAELLSGKEPNNESIDDSLIDIINYSALLTIYRKEQNGKDN